MESPSETAPTDPAKEAPRVVVCGEALIDLVHAPSDPAGRYQAHVGGGPHNTAIGLARLGTPTAFLGRLSVDPFGQLIRASFSESGVGFDHVVDTTDPTMLAVATLSASGQADYGFYTALTADVGLLGSMLTPFAPSVQALHFGTLSLALEPLATTLAALFEHSRGKRLLALDPNVRPSAITDLDAYRTRIERLLSLADVVKISDADVLALWPDRPFDETARRLAASGPALLCVTRGADGVDVHHHSGAQHVAADTVEVVDTIGAGDSFNAALLHWLDCRSALTRTAVEALSPEAVQHAVVFAAKAAAVTCSRAGANPPWAGELGPA